MRSFAALAAVVVCVCALQSPARSADMSSVATLVKPAPGGVPWSAAQIARLQGAIGAILTRPTLRGAQAGLLAIDTTRGTVLFSREADTEFMPASNFKLLTGSAALQLLGRRFTFVTRIASDGTNLYLRGGGDALLRARDLEAAAAALAARGMTRVDGSLVTDAGHDDDQRLGFGWSWDDLPYYYAPVVTALELEDGIVHVYMSPGAAVGDPVRLRIDPQSSAFTILNHAITGAVKSKDTTDLSRPWNQPLAIEFTGSYPLGSKESDDVEPSVPDPESYAGDVFAKALAAHGIALNGSVRTGSTLPGAATLWSHASEAMPQLLADFWYPSDNLMGELFLKELGAAASGEPGTDDHGSAAERRYLQSTGVDPSTVTIADGSGLSQYDRITPRDLVAILQADWNGPDRDVVLDALPVSGVRGSLKSSYKGTPAERAVFAKTGSINHVRTISGFVRTKTHGPVTFSLMLNQWMGEDAPHGSEDLAKLRGDLFSTIAQQ